MGWRPPKEGGFRHRIVGEIYVACYWDVISSRHLFGGNQAATPKSCWSSPLRRASCRWATARTSLPQWPNLTWWEFSNNILRRYLPQNFFILRLYLEGGGALGCVFLAPKPETPIFIVFRDLETTQKKRGSSAWRSGKTRSPCRTGEKVHKIFGFKSLIFQNEVFFCKNVSTWKVTKRYKNRGFGPAPKKSRKSPRPKPGKT